MNEYNEGDLVEAVKGEERITQRLAPALEGLWMKALNMSVSEARRSGYAFTLIEPAAPKVVLPTEPGWYLDKEGDVWKLETDGLYPAWSLSGNAQSISEAILYTPFVRLESRADTAKAVLERTSEILSNGGIHTLPMEFGNLAAEFGVTS